MSFLPKTSSSLYSVLHSKEAVARGFELELPQMDRPECYYHSLPAELNPKRDRMAAFLAEVGMNPTVPEGGYFMIADFSKLSMWLIHSCQITVSSNVNLLQYCMFIIFRIFVRIGQEIDFV